MKDCPFCKPKFCTNTECEYSHPKPIITKGLYSSTLAPDLNVDVLSVINFPNKEYMKVKLILKYKNSIVCEKAKWYKIQKNGFVQYWEKIK